MEEIMLALAAAVVKTAFKIWTKDSELANNVTDEFTDLVKDKVVGLSGKRRARRWVEDLEETVSARLAGFLDHEFSGLSDNERQAAVLAVADTLARARLTDRALLEKDLDPLHLERFLRNAVPDAERDLGYQARGLYSRLLPEACAYVISLTTNLPDFQVGAFGELLRRDTAIIARLDEILKLLPTQKPGNAKLAAGSAGEADQKFAVAYRRQVVTRLDHLRLFGVDVFTQQYPLTLAYIGLSVSSYRPSHQRAARLKLRSGLESSELPIEAVLESSRRLFLIGQAGSGKTTILQWLAVRAARKDFPGDLASLNNYEPFFIPLRRYVDKQLPPVSQFVQLIGRNIGADMPAGWVERNLAAGSALILLDGMDELPSYKHEEVKQWVRILTADYPECAYVITSRPGAVSDNWFASLDFASASLAAMSSTAVVAFVTQWIESLRSETVDREERELLSGYEQPIIKALVTERHLRELAATPLLCALLCALYYARSGELPADRMGVYAAAFDMLGRRDTERGIRENAQIGKAEGRIILQYIAYWLIRNGLTDAAIARIIEQINQSKRHLHKVSADAEVIYQHLLVRSGLIQEPAADRVSFIHRTFQEYLAARAAVDGDNLEELASHALDTRWTQVVIMAAGHASPVQRERLLRALVMPAKREKRKPELALVALACLETSPSISAELLRAIRSAADAVIPPRRRADVDLLVRAGELTLDILINEKIHTPEQALMVMEIACRINSGPSLDVVAHVLRQQPAVASEPALGQIWRSFQPEDVAIALTQLKDITNVFVELPRCSSAVPLLTNAATIDCAAIGPLPSLSCFRKLSGLRKLTIHSAGVVDLSPLAGTPNLAICVMLTHDQSRATFRSPDLLARYVVGADQLGELSTIHAAVEKSGARSCQPAW